ncbi:MAG: glycosyltransferase family 1 protein [Bacteroidetes Order II. Incertae sedis bacterium]|nr:glycosyltransferase family 1 protein [Bacteroidetes Order II. bacterium]
MAPTPHIAIERDKRVALFTGAYNHVVDGVSLTLNRLVSYLECEEIPVHVFAPSVDDPPIEHAGTMTDVPSFNMPGRPEYQISFGMSPRVFQELEQFKPTIVHIATPDFLGLQALKYARKRNIPVVASYHTHFSSYLAYYRMQKLEGAMWAYLRWFYERCEHLYVPSNSMANVLKEHGIDKGIELWPRGVDVRLFNPSKRSMSWRRDHGFADDEIVVSFISRLVVEKGLDVYADVLQKLKDAGKNVRALVVGSGPAEDMLRGRFPRAHFLGHLEGEELAKAYASSDLFLFPSTTETFGNVTLEAMASGIPTLCADATGSSSLVVHEKTGYLAIPGEIDSFVDYALRLVNSLEKRQEMGLAARTEAETYSWRRILGKIDSYYDHILTPAPSGDGLQGPSPSRMTTNGLAITP